MSSKVAFIFFCNDIISALLSCFFQMEDKQDAVVEMVPVSSTNDEQLNLQEVRHPCPICGDKISGNLQFT